MKRFISVLFIILVLSTLAGFIFWYFFIPINPDISKNITRATPMRVYIYNQNSGNGIHQMLNPGRLFDEDLSLFDKLYFAEIISKCKTANYSVDADNPQMGGYYPVLLRISFLPDDNSPNLYSYELSFVPPNDRNQYFKGEKDFDVAFWDNNAQISKSFCVQMDFERVFEKYYERGLKLDEERGKNAEEKKEKAYSEAIEKIESGE